MTPNSHILDAFERPTWAIGGENAWKTTEYRGYLVSLEWLIEPQETAPMLVLQPLRPGPDRGAWGIGLHAVGLFLDQNGTLTKECEALCWDALEVLGRPKLNIEVRNLMAVIHRWLPEVILMPPAPVALRREEAGAPILEVELKDENTGKTVSEVSV